MLDRTDLHPYQEFCVQYILDHPIAAIILDCGLGKTAITLTAINYLLYTSFEINRVLIIAPLRVAFDVWPNEIRKWKHLRNLRVSVAVGTAEQRREALSADADLYVINRENVPWLIEESGVPFNFDMLVIDELSSFKNHQAKRFKSLMKRRPKISRVVGLTGTPSSNGLMDLFAEYRLLDMGQRLGRFIGRYREAYFRPDRYGYNVVYSYKPRPGAEAQIYERIGDITVSMKSGDYLRMPECIRSRTEVVMSESEKQTYEKLKRDLIVQLPPNRTIDAKNAAALCGKLSQMANGAVYTDDGGVALIHDRKLDALEDLIEAAYGKPVLVAYWFQHDLERIRKRIDGVRTIKTAKDIEDWNAGRIAVAAIHPASAGHGLNLQAGGSTLVWFGLTWSLELYQQTNARLWRQGQRADTVVIQHIVTAGTIDENILAALEAKDVTQEALMRAVKARLDGEART